MKKRSVKSINKELDALWSELVKMWGEGKCAYCGMERNLNSHHLFSRSNLSVRWYIPNGICLCVGHHVFSSIFSAHKTPVEFTLWLTEKYGETFVDKLRAEARRNIKLSYHERIELLEHLRKMKKDYEQTGEIDAMDFAKTYG